MKAGQVRQCLVTLVILALVGACESTQEPRPPELEEALVTAARHAAQEVAPRGIDLLDPEGFPEQAVIAAVAEALGVRVGGITTTCDGFECTTTPAISGYARLHDLRILDSKTVIIQVTVARIGEAAGGSYSQIDSYTLHCHDDGWRVGSVERVAES